jgi:Superfamily I DNA and RNA helicases
MGFNSQQKEVILHGETPLMVVSAAGSGKSTTLVGRAVKKVKEGKRNLCAITFTRNTAEDLTRKFKKAGVSNYIDVGTFHSICGNILRKEGVNISKRVKDYEIENLFKKIIQDEKKIDMKDIMSFISYQKNNMIGYKDDFVEKDSCYGEDQLRECFRAYEEYKVKIGAYDFDDYLILGHKVLMENPRKYEYDYLFVDETQDSNEIQMEIVDLLCPSGRVTVFGDAQQCMYSFRGSRPELFMDFYKSHPNTHVVNMNINYRSHKEIVEKSNDFIRQYYGDYEYYSDAVANSNEHAEIELMVNDLAEAEAQDVCDKVQTMLSLGYKGSDIAILFRNNVQSQHIENEFKVRDIDYFIESEGGFFNRKEIDIIMCMLRLVDNPEDDSAFEKLFRYRCEPFVFLANTILSDIITLSAERNISHLEASTLVHVQPWQSQKLRWFANTIEKLITQHNSGYSLLQIINNIISTLDMDNYIRTNYPNEEDQKERLESLDNLKKFIRSNTLDTFLKFVYEKNTSSESKNSENKVQMMTVHKSKGLEFKVVFVVGIATGKFPSEKSYVEEEANVWYVAITRAIERMYLSQIGSYNLFVEQYFGEDKYPLLVQEALY